VVAVLSPTKPLNKHDVSFNSAKPELEKAPELAAINSAPSTMNLVAVQLPLPPASNPAPAAIQVDAKVKSLKSEVPQPKQAPLDAATPATESLGFDLLAKADGPPPEINIALPNDALKRARVSKFLRECLGVHLGKIDSQGQLMVKEQSHHDRSPYVRLVGGMLISGEQLIVNSWKQREGNVVRFYPDYVDARLFGGLQKMLGHGFADMAINSAKITGQYRLKYGALTLEDIHINGQRQVKELLLAKAC